MQDDLPNKVVTSHEIATYAKENGYFQWVFISVKENKNISEAMQYVIHVKLLLGICLQSHTRTSGDGGNQMLLSSVANYCIVGNFHTVQIFTFFMGMLVNVKLKKNSMSELLNMRMLSIIISRP